MQRTKQEIELRERSAPPGEDPAARPVQRSASLKTERAHRRDRNSERRRTCVPLISPSPSGEDLKKEFSFVRQDRDGHVTLYQDLERRRSSSDVTQNATNQSEDQCVKEPGAQGEEDSSAVKESTTNEVEALDRSDVISLKIGPEVVELKAGVVQKWKRGTLRFVAGDVPKS